MGFTKEDEKALEELNRELDKGLVTRQEMLARFGRDFEEVMRRRARARVSAKERAEMTRRRARMAARHSAIAKRAGEAIAALIHKAMPTQATMRVGKRTGRNEACPCGSGQKYKRCHGKARGAR
jgi:preprotein translocase subunit SecA